MDPTTQRMMMSSTGGQLGVEWEDKSIHLSDGAGGIVSTLQDVGLFGGVFIAVGSSATLLRSTDGISWARVSPPVGIAATAFFTAIAQNPTTGRIVVTSTNGTIYSDNLGVSWVSALTGVRLLDVAFGNNRFVAVGGNGSASFIYNSTDGASWTPITPPAGVTEDLLGIAYGTPSGVAGGRWVAIGNGSSTAGARYIFSNDTGVTWTNITLTTTDNVSGITWAGGSINLYVVAGFTISSGLPFVRTSAAGNAAFPTVYTSAAQVGTLITNTVEYLNSTLILLGNNNQVVTSTNGTTWTVPQAGETGDSTSSGIAYSSGLGRYVFVGFSSSRFGDQVNTATAASVWYSSSLLRGGSTYVYDGAPLYGAIYVPSLNKYFVSGNAGKIFSSTDFSNWTGKYLSQPVAVKAFFFDGTRIIAGGTGAGSNYIFSSTDGTTWTQNYSGGTPQVMNGGIYGGYSGSSVTHVIYGGDTSGPGRLWYSSNGTSWSTMTPSSNIYYSGLYTNDPNVVPYSIFGSREDSSFTPTGLDVDIATDPATSVAFYEAIPAANVGGSPGFATFLKVTGITYMQEPSLPNSKIVYLVNRLFNSSVTATYVVSTTPFSYVYANGSVGAATQLNAVTIAPPSGVLVAVGGQTISSYSIPYIQTSIDSLTWTQRVTPGSTTYRSALLGVVYTNNRYIAVGVNGVVLVSQL